MKTIISGRPDPDKRKAVPRRRLAVFGAGVALACVLPVAAIVLPAHGEPPDDPVAAMGRAGASEPQAMSDYVHDPGPAGTPDAQSGQAPARSPDLLVEKSGQLTYDDGADDANDNTQGPAAGIAQDVPDGLPDGAGNDVETAMIPVGTKDVQDLTGGADRDPVQDAQDAAAAAAELKAAREELEAARKQLEAERKAREAAEAAVREAERQASEQQAQAPEAPVDTAPPDWLAPQEAEPVAEPVQEDPLDWLFTALDKAMWRNPYDGGPLCQTSYAQIPCPLENADTRLYVELGAPVSTLTQGDLIAFVKQAIEGCDASWATIVGSDGYGLQFPGCSTDFAFYGPLDEYGQVTDAQYIIMLTEYGYGIADAKG